MNTVIDGGSLKVQYYAAMDGITMNSGSIEIINYPDPNSSHIKPVDSPIDLGDIIVNGGTISLNHADIKSGITITSGADAEIDVSGEVKTGALTLNSGTINVGSESVKSTLTTNGVLLVDGATLNLINGNLEAVSMNSGSIVVSTGSTIEALTLSGGTLSGDLSGCTVTTAGDDEESVKVSVNVTDGDITAVEGTELSGTISEGALTTKAGSKVSADITDTEITATGGEISGTISGTSSVEVKDGGPTTLSGDNSYTGGTTVSNGALTAGSNKALGTGTVKLGADGELNLNSKEVSNDIEAAGGVISGADQYLGNLVVSDDLTIVGNATARSITMLNDASIVQQNAALFSLRATRAAAGTITSAMNVRTAGDGHFTGNLTLDENGLIELNNGNALVVTGSLTLGNGTKIVLNGDYAAGDTLVSATESLTSGEVTLVYDNDALVMKLLGNSLVLVGNFMQDRADAVAQGNWGIASASRAFVNTVRGQHSNTGCIANGRGTVWAGAFGAFNDMDGADIDVKGAAVGVDARVGACSTVGLAVGYADGEVSPAGLQDVDQEGTYVALYGAHGLKKLSSASCLSMDWVATYGNTESDWNGMEWEQESLQLNTRLNWNRQLTDRLSMSVFGGLEYFATESDTVNGVKTGSIQNLRGEIGVGARYVAWGAPASTASYDEKGAMVTAARPGCEKLVLNGEIRYMNDMVRSNPVIRMNGICGGSENPGRQGMGIEAGATYRIGERWSASANYGFNAMEDSREHRVNVGASYTF